MTLTAHERIQLAAEACRSLSTVNRRCRGQRVNNQSEAALKQAAQRLDMELPELPPIEQQEAA